MVRIGDTTLPITLSLEASTPLYEQIESQLRQLIVSSVLAAGTPLPSVRMLASNLGCSVITTRRAYQDLEQEGLIHTLQGRGTIVADVPEEIRLQHQHGPIERSLQSAIAQARAAGLSHQELRTMFEQILTEEESQS